MPAKPEIGSLRHILFIEDALGNLIATRWASIDDTPGLPTNITIRYLPVLSFGHRLRLGAIAVDYPDLTALAEGELTAADYAAMVSEPGLPPIYFRIESIDNEQFRNTYQVIGAIKIPPLIHQVTVQSPTRTASSVSSASISTLVLISLVEIA